MVACSDDAPITAGGEGSYGSGNDGEGYYMTVNVQLPTPGSRSQTTTDGNSNADPSTEIGFEYENDVNDILIVLADATDNSFITAGSVAGAKLNPVPSQNAYRPIAKLDKTDLAQFYNENTNRTINVFVFCNPTKDLVNSINELNLGDTKWVDLTCTVLEGNGQTPTNVGVWGQNGFLMSNKKICTRQLPATFNDWKNFNTEASAFNLSGTNHIGDDNDINNSGAVEVERSVARFDFRDGSPLGNNTYNVIYTLDENNKQIPLFNVQLDRMMLTNEAKEFYYLPRVSDDGKLNGSNYALCGSEYYTLTGDGNYVVGPYAGITKGEFEGNFSKYFNYPFFNDKNQVDYTQWTTTYLNDVIGKTADNLTDEQLKDEYYVWRYVTENVIPADNNNQTMGRTTMVVFKGRLVPAEAAFTSTDANVKAIAEAISGGKLTGDPTKDPAIYYFNNIAYFGWENIKKAAIESALQFQTITVGEGDDAQEVTVPTYEEKEVDGVKIKYLTGVRHSSSLYMAVFGDGCMGKITWGETTYYDQPEGMSVDSKSTNSLYEKYEKAKADDNIDTDTIDTDTIDTDTALLAFKKAVTTQDITIYESSIDSKDGAGYYFYYYYKNRHNDNGDNGTMGTMEFATVRNNVYKLAVTKINALGHPRIPENDPDAPAPGTPDETDDLYITVTCRVLPWVVRLNNIEF